jgi:hypothetical protein
MGFFRRFLCQNTAETDRCLELRQNNPVFGIAYFATVLVKNTATNGEKNWLSDDRWDYPGIKSVQPGTSDGDDLRCKIVP